MALLRVWLQYYVVINSSRFYGIHTQIHFYAIPCYPTGVGLAIHFQGFLSNFPSIIYFNIQNSFFAHLCFIGNRTTTTATTVVATTATTATTLKAFCDEHDFLQGNISYTDPADRSFGPRQEGSQAVFKCDPGYQLSHNNAVTCKEGQWTGAMPSCVDIDECADVDCGGPSHCTNRRWTLYLRMCARLAWWWSQQKMRKGPLQMHGESRILQVRK